MLPGLGLPRPGMLPPGMLPLPPGPVPPGLQHGAMGLGGAPGGRPPEVEEQLGHLREDMQKLEAAAADMQKLGDDSGARFKLLLAGEVRDKIRELEEKHPPAPTGPPPGFMMPGLGMMRPPNGISAGLGFAPLVELPQTNFTQQQALLYEAEKANSHKMEPEVMELIDHFALSDRHARMLNEQMKKRNDTFDDDLKALYELLGKANNHAQKADLLSINIRWMAEGVFNGIETPSRAVAKAMRKFKLDGPSCCKLAEALEGRTDPEEDMRKINTHLERSNKPSSLCMMMLKDSRLLALHLQALPSQFEGERGLGCQATAACRY
ncbi:unnamed protein product [Prorocentrum cordatum]|uniref:Uncharacterized protein n=1 Tax=Prorocentrum cordatum TaxID=2364126 RepID=A0ABN9TYZ4_9DINO|nr:unnamed protein product [Polarella glacialis]